MAVLTEEDKVLIEALRNEKGFGAKWIIREFQARQWRLGTVNKFLQKLAATGSRARRAGSGRPRTARTIDNVKAVEDLALSEEDQPGTSLSDRELAKAVGISRSSVRRIVREDLQLKVFKRVAATELNAATQAKRLSRAKDLLRRFKSQDVKKICFSDEKIFSVSAPVSLQNDRVRGRVAKKTELPAANLIRERQKSRASVMVSLGVTADHKTSVIFVPPGVKINSMEYQNVILGPLLADIRAMGPDFVFQQDGAPSHTSKSTLRFLAEKQQPIIEPSMWPPSSPDLNPLDYFVWPALEALVYRGGRIRDVAHLGVKIVSAVEQLGQASIRRAINSWRCRLKKVVQAKGGHIEPFIGK